MTEPIPFVSRQMPAVLDHTRQYDQFLYVYPVISRRSQGLSLGINLNPDKRCNFDCIYCEVDRRTPPRTARVDGVRLREELVALIRLVKAGRLEADPRFRTAPHLLRDIRDLAFSGDGEPTMIGGFAECVQTVAEVKMAEGLDQTKIVLITNAAGLDKADVRHGLEILDAHQGEIWGKLDAGTESYYRRINRSHVRFDRILSNLLETARVRPIVIQSLFLRVHGEAMPADELAAYCGRLEELAGAGGRVREVQAYTVARPTPEAFAARLEPAELDALAAAIHERTGLTVHVFP